VPRTSRAHVGAELRTRRAARRERQQGHAGADTARAGHAEVGGPLGPRAELGCAGRHGGAPRRTGELTGGRSKGERAGAGGRERARPARLSHGRSRGRAGKREGGGCVGLDRGGRRGREGEGADRAGKGRGWRRTGQGSCASEEGIVRGGSERERFWGRGDDRRGPQGRRRRHNRRALHARGERGRAGPAAGPHAGWGAS
jgi:hypothetical protein